MTIEARQLTVEEVATAQMLDKAAFTMLLADGRVAKPEGKGLFLIAPVGFKGRVWGEWILETVYETGNAARRNRGRYTGHTVHVLASEYVVGFVAGANMADRINADVARVLAAGKKRLHACHPCCGCTQGQHAGAPASKPAAVTCTRCQRVRHLVGQKDSTPANVGDVQPATI